MRKIRVISDFVFDTEIILLLLVSFLAILGIPAPFYSPSWYIVYALLAALLILWISSVAIVFVLELAKQRLTSADKLFLSAAVCILISSLSVSLATISSTTQLWVSSLLTWVSLQSLSAGLLLIALLNYTQTFRKRLGNSQQDMKLHRMLLMGLFSTLLFTSYLSTFFIGNSIGAVSGLLAILVLRFSSVFVFTRVLELSISVEMTSMNVFLLLGMILGAMGDIFFAISLIETKSFYLVWSTSNHILGAFFFLASCLSFQRWSCSPSGTVRLLQNAMEIIVSGVMELARKTRGRR